MLEDVLIYHWTWCLSWNVRQWKELNKTVLFLTWLQHREKKKISLNLDLWANLWSSLLTFFLFFFIFFVPICSLSPKTLSLTCSLPHLPVCLSLSPLILIFAPETKKEERKCSQWKRCYADLSLHYLLKTPVRERLRWTTDGKVIERSH